MSFLYISADDTSSYVADLKVGSKVVFRSARVKAFLPNFFGTWLDNWTFGCSIVLFVVWWKRARRYEHRGVCWMLYIMMITAAVSSGWNLSYCLLSFGKLFGTADMLLINTFWPRYYGLICLAMRIPASSFLLYRASTITGHGKWLVTVGSLLITGMTVTAIAHTAVSAMDPLGSGVRACSLVASACGLAADLLSAGVIARAWRSGLGAPSVVIKEHALVRLTFSAAEIQLPALIASLILYLLALARAVPAQRIFLCHPKLAFICVVLTLKRQSSIHRALNPSWSQDQGTSSLGNGNRGTNSKQLMGLDTALGSVSMASGIAPHGHGPGMKKEPRPARTMNGTGGTSGMSGMQPSRSPVRMQHPLQGRRSHHDGDADADADATDADADDDREDGFIDYKPPASASVNSTSSTFEAAMYQETRAPFVLDSVDTLPYPTSMTSREPADEAGGIGGLGAGSPMKRLSSPRKAAIQVGRDESIRSVEGDETPRKATGLGDSQIALVHAM